MRHGGAWVKLINLISKKQQKLGFRLNMILQQGVRWGTKHCYSKCSMPHRTSVLFCCLNGERNILSVKINTRVQLQACLKLCDMAAIDSHIMVANET